MNRLTRILTLFLLLITFIVPCFAAEEAADGSINYFAPMMDDEAYGVDALMWIGMPGSSGTLGIAELLSGKKNPKGCCSTAISFCDTITLTINKK